MLGVRYGREAVLAVALAYTALPAAAQEGWTIEATTYLWFPTTASTVQTPFGPAETELSAKDALEDLEFGIMGTVISRRGPWALTGDLIYLDLQSTDEVSAGLAFTDIETDTTLTAISIYGSYAVVSGPTYAIEVGAGLRGISSTLDVVFRLQDTTLGTFEVEDAWVDPVLAARATGTFGERWTGALTVDYGGFGWGNASDETWQVIATMGYRVNDRWSIQGGYRQLRFERENDGVDYEVDLSGPILGATYRF
ncbi:outer membrane beta-barrel protein [Rubellimicrobium roseum]|nr:outer membrane beta-barrel protein [Rubellimicrobium roseum]